MKCKFILFFLFTFIFSILVISQTKDEREERIKFTDLPKPVKTIAERLPQKVRRIKFYRETDGNKKSFEIKLKYKGLRYSIECSEIGVLEDIEVLTKFTFLDHKVRNEIVNYFKQNYLKNKILKVQKQYVFDNSSDASKFIENVLIQKIKTPYNYEIIAEIKTLEKRVLKEFTFNTQGLFKNFRIVIPTSYEYVLY